MAGHKTSDYTDDSWDFMTYAMSRREEVEYMKLTVLVSAIITAGRIAAGGDAGDSLRNALNSFRSTMFPEIESDLLEKAMQNEKILEQEYRKGALKVKPLDYSKRKKQRR